MCKWGGTDETIGVETVIGTITVGGTTYNKYRKIVDLGGMPANTSKNVAHGISGNLHFLSIYGIASYPSQGYSMPLPYFNTAGNAACVSYIDNTYIHFIDNYDWSSYTVAYLILEYYK